MKRKAIVLMTTLFFLMGGMGCEKDLKYEIYENHEISACGIRDPLNNIEWLAKMKKDPKILTSIVLYKNIHSEEYYFSFNMPNELGYTTSMFYDCSGKNIFGWNTATPPGGLYEEFHSDKEFVAVIWEVKNK
ncbi:MAG: hypothetical protein Q4G63_12955 [Bacteroidia bacterium]|nr:hypothetical protein [Bacteroidia bacterium]